MSDTPLKRKLQWQCRRGMLELDMLLLPFYETCYDDLSESEQQTFVELLSFEDPTLLQWFIHQEPASSAALQTMVDKISAHALSNT